MTIELSLSIIISMVSVSFAIYSGLKSGKRADVKDVEERARELTRTNVMLENINKTMGEIKEQILAIAQKVDSHGERITKVEESLATVWRRIDEQKDRVTKIEEMLSDVSEKIDDIKAQI